MTPDVRTVVQDQIAVVKRDGRFELWYQTGKPSGPVRCASYGGPARTYGTVAEAVAYAEGYLDGFPMRKYGNPLQRERV